MKTPPTGRGSHKVLRALGLFVSAELGELRIPAAQRRLLQWVCPPARKIDGLGRGWQHNKDE